LKKQFSLTTFFATSAHHWSSCKQQLHRIRCAAEINSHPDYTPLDWPMAPVHAGVSGSRVYTTAVSEWHPTSHTHTHTHDLIDSLVHGHGHGTLNGPPSEVEQKQTKLK